MILDQCLMPSPLCLMPSALSFAGTLMDCYDELGNRYQLPVYVLSSPTNLIEDVSETDTAVDTENSSPGTEIPIKFRLSHTNKDLKLFVRTTDTVMKLKKRIGDEQGIDPSKQRWFFSGRLLNDKLRVVDAKIPKGYVVQVIVSEPDPSIESWAWSNLGDKPAQWQCYDHS